MCSKRTSPLAMLKKPVKNEQSIKSQSLIGVHPVKTFSFPVNISSYKTVFLFFFFFLVVNLGTRPAWSNLLSSLEVGGTLQLPGSNLSSILIDKNNDNIVDGIDFDNDGLADLAVLDIGREKTVGIDENSDGSPSFYITELEGGDLIIINTLDQKIDARDSTTLIKKIYIWDDLSFTGVGNYSFTFGDFSSIFPLVFGGALYIDLGLDGILSNLTGLKRHSWFPGLRIAGTYNIGNSSDFVFKTSLIGLQAGPLWHIEIHSEHHGYFMISPLIGVANLSLHDERGLRQGFSFDANLSLGYEYRLGSVTFSLGAIAKYILSSQGLFFQVVAFGGAGFNIKL